DTSSTYIYTLSLHDALPICRFRQARELLCPSDRSMEPPVQGVGNRADRRDGPIDRVASASYSARRSNLHRSWRLSSRQSDLRSRSEEHTSELQSPYDLVCRL